MTNSPVLSVIALVVSVLAALFTFLQWRDSHNQLLLSKMPSINITTVTDDTPSGISIEDAGPGAAQIKAVTYFVNGFPVKDVDKVMEAADLPDDLDVDTLELGEGDTVGVGKTDWLIECRRKPRNKKDQDELDKFYDFLNHHVAVEVTYCPVLGTDCSKKCSVTKWCSAEAK